MIENEPKKILGLFDLRSSRASYFSNSGDLPNRGRWIDALTTKSDGERQ